MTLLRRGLLAVALTCSALLVALPSYLALQGVSLPARAQATSDPASATARLAAPVEQKEVNSPLPVRLKIPSINVDAVIEYVGLTEEGAMDVPYGPATTGWFELGPRPGETGNSVINGHFGWKDDIPAVFDDLHTLQKGDRIYVEDENGVLTAFVVREIRTYGENENASEVFNSSDGGSHLNLITCEGTWNKAAKSYSDRLVVFTDKENE